MKTLCSGALLCLKQSSLLALTVFLGISLFPPSDAFANTFEAETVTVDRPYTFPTPPGVKTGGVFFDAITAVSETGDRLLSASSPAAARVEIHRMRMDGDIMRMREVGEVVISKTAPVPFHKGAHDGYHLMLMELKQPLTNDMTLPVTLRFEQAGDVEVEVTVLPLGSHPKQRMMNHSDHTKHQ